MKTTLFMFLFFGSLVLYPALDIISPASPVNGTESAISIEEITWDKTTHDFGQIEQHQPATALFKVTNLNDQPLVITGVKAGCGCTAAFAEDEIIAPGEYTVISATYNAKKPGAFNKSVKVSTSLNKEPQLLYIQGEVMASK